MAVGMMNVNASAFSPDLKYFSQISSEGKLKIWDTENSALKQEFTPNFHLNAPCTCLHWMKHTKAQPHKRKRKSLDRSFVTEDKSATYIVLLGTSQGNILLYSLGEGHIVGDIGEDNTGHNASISCLVWDKDNTVYSCAEDCTIIEWDLNDKTKISNWSTGKDMPTALHLISSCNRIISASRTIKIWCLETKTLLKTFTGHSSLVSILKSVTISKENGQLDTYILSGSKNDRILNAWNIEEKPKNKDPSASFLMEDIPYDVCIEYESQDNGVCITAVTRSGVLHYYKHIMNGKCDKPLKPKLTMQVVFDNLGKQNASNNKVQPVPILSGHIITHESILIGHGTQLNMTFEKVKPQPIGKIQVLVRQNPQLMKINSNDVAQKTKFADVENVEYISPTSGHAANLKRTSSKKIELPMESRLENLSLVDSKSKNSVPKFDNMSHLLIQGLHSKDKNILQGVLMKKDEKVIQNTISRLPVQYLIPLMKELTSYIHGKTLSAQIGTTWLRIVLQSHAAHLMSIGSETLVDVLSPCLGLIETRLSLLQPLSRLQGRLDLLINQISGVQSNDTDEYDEKNLLVYQDPDSNASDSDEMAGGQSSSEENWEEFSDNEEQAEEMAVEENVANEVSSESE